MLILGMAMSTDLNTRVLGHSSDLFSEQIFYLLTGIFSGCPYNIQCILIFLSHLITQLIFTDFKYVMATVFVSKKKMHRTKAMSYCH